MNDQNLKPEDLATDETFIAWFNGSNPEHVRFWDNWINLNGDKKDAVDKAVELLSLLESKDTGVSDEHTLAARDRLMSAIYATKKTAPVVAMRRRSIWWASAASVIAIVVLSIMYFASRERSQYVTDFAETRAIVLPDGSQVTLNANSSLRMSDHWTPGSDREVWLDGEGFFSVKHTAMNTKFIVHTNDINVEVLGTEFNLQHRRQLTTVVLHTGKVQLTEVDNHDAVPVIMKPGDLVEYNKNTQKITRKIVETEIYTAWKEGKMIFDNADFNEIAQVLEENYGLKVNTGNMVVKGKQFNGVFPTNNLQVLLTALGKAYDIDIQVNDKEITIHNIKNPQPKE